MYLPESFESSGFAIIPALLASIEVTELINLVEKNTSVEAGRGGVRDVMHVVPQLREVANHSAVRALVDQILGAQAFAVRATLFDKTSSANWKVPWHQDVTIAVRERCEAEGYGPWSIKAGVSHVQPPSHVLQNMVSVRVHLDDCPASNGALRVMPGTHLLGKLNQNHADAFVDEAKAVCCEVSAGGALVMHPLLLHASSPAVEPRHRRVLHFDYAVCGLDGGLEWNMRARQPCIGITLETSGARRRW